MTLPPDRADHSAGDHADDHADVRADYLDPTQPDPELPVAERRALDRVAATLASPDSWSEPPAGLRAALLQAVRREQAGTAPEATPPEATPPEAAPPEAAPLEATPPAVTPPAVTPPAVAPTQIVPLAADPTVVPLRRRSRRTWYVSGLGVAAAAVLVAVIAWPRPNTETYQIAGTALAPRASAVAVLETRSAGLAIRLEIKGLPPAAPGSYYAAWLEGKAGIVPVGTFHWRKGGIPIDLWSGVAADGYPSFFVTLQREGQPPSPSSAVVLSGQVRR